jgi:iron-sulfur cluster repair protein YtfE (RIC family)
MWSEPESTTSASSVREQVLAQHATLRDLLRRVLDTTTLTLRGDDEAAQEMDRIVREFRSRFRAHLGYEERFLAPVLAEVDIWGPQRVADLLNEHINQRAELDTLIEGIEGGWDPQRLAVATRALVTELMVDMEEEERGCLSAELLRDDVISVDQATD